MTSDSERQEAEWLEGRRYEDKFPADDGSPDGWLCQFCRVANALTAEHCHYCGKAKG